MAGSVRPSPSMSTQMGVPGPGRGSTWQEAEDDPAPGAGLDGTRSVEPAVGHGEGAVAGGDRGDRARERACDPDLGEVAGPIQAQVGGEAVAVRPGAAWPSGVDVGALEGAAEGDDQLRLAVLRDVAERGGREPVRQARVAAGARRSRMARRSVVGWAVARGTGSRGRSGVHQASSRRTASPVGSAQRPSGARSREA